MYGNLSGMLVQIIIFHNIKIITRTFLVTNVMFSISKAQYNPKILTIIETLVLIGHRRFHAFLLTSQQLDVH